MEAIQTDAIGTETKQSAFDFTRLWDEKTVAAYLSVSLYFLRQDRVVRRRIPFIKLGSAVRYDPADVQAYVRSVKVTADA